MSSNALQRLALSLFGKMSVVQPPQGEEVASSAVMGVFWFAMVDLPPPLPGRINKKGFHLLAHLISGTRTHCQPHHSVVVNASGTPHLTDPQVVAIIGVFLQVTISWGPSN